MKILRHFALSLILLMLLSGMAEAESILIVNNSVTQTSISKEDVKLIFLGKKKKWDDGKMIHLAALKDGEVNESFIKEYVNKTPSNYSSFWRMVIISGTGHPPKFFEEEAALVNYVANKEGAIGYISSTTPHEGVKTLLIK